MKKVFCLIFLLCLFVYCGPKQEGAKEFKSLSMEEEFTIDTERKDLAERNFVDIGEFDVDSEGNIYIESEKSGENLIFKFDPKGSLIFSFAKKGRGPGELLDATSLSVNDQDQIFVFDRANSKICLFSGEGSLIKEEKIEGNFLEMSPLSNGNYLVRKNFPTTADYIQNESLIVVDPKFKELAKLDGRKVPNPMAGKKIKGSFYILSWALSDDLIFTGFQERGYEISVYDFSGNLIREIKKDYEPVPVTEEYKNAFMKLFEDPLFDRVRDKIRKNIYFPSSLPPFHSFISDDRGRLFVMTYEECDNPEDHMFDIFSRDGTFMGKAKIALSIENEGFNAEVKNDRFYCLREKESGYMELVVNKMQWE